MAPDHALAGSILAVDCGSTATRALLIARIEGAYRLVARGEAPCTLGPPCHDLAASVRHALEQIAEVTGWGLLGEHGQAIRPVQEAGGVDLQVAVTSLAEPLRVILVAPTHQVSLDAARRALPASHAVVEGLVVPQRYARGRSVSCDDWEGQVGLIQGLVPDAIVLVGGVDNGAAEPVLQAARAIAWACSALPGVRQAPPFVVYAGNAGLVPTVAKILGPYLPMRVVENVLPALHLENPGPLHMEIEALHRRLKMEPLPGFARLAAWSSLPVLPTAKGFAQAVQYLAASQEVDVLGVDVGGATTTVVKVADGQLRWAVHTGLGVGRGAARILDYVPVESVQRWLPFEASPGTVCDAVYHKTVWPNTVPQTSRDLMLEQAMAREVLRITLADASLAAPAGGTHVGGRATPPRLIVGSGRILTGTPNYGQSALVLLDALQPVGISRLVLDRAGLLALAGAVAMRAPQAAAHLVERDALLNLGTVLTPPGAARDGEMAMTCRLEYEDGRSLEVEVPSGSLQVIPLPLGQQGTLTWWPTRRAVPDPQIRGGAEKVQVEGGVVGIVVDARGRPLPLAGTGEEQRSNMQGWLREVES